MAYTQNMLKRNPYPEREGNAFRLLAGADVFLPAMELAIHRAKRFVLFEQYLINSGHVAERFIDAFEACVQRGLAVYMLLDHFGARGLSRADRRRITDAGIELVFYNPAYLSHFFRGLPRNHCKALLIDGEVAYTGGAGICDDYEAHGSTLPWQDVIVEMRGPVIADWQDQFTHVWRHWDGEIDIPDAPALPVGKQCGRLVVSLRGLHKFIRLSLISRIRQSRNRAWLATAYWIPTRKTLWALRAAKRRGVDVRLLLPGAINDHPAVYHAGHRYYHYLLRNGIRIFEYQPAFMHAKHYLCDDWCSIGSCNMDRWGLRWNLEANLESADARLCAETEALFKKAFAASREITLSEWLERPLGSRLWEWLFGYVDLVIERYGVAREARKIHAKQRPEP